MQLRTYHSTVCCLTYYGNIHYLNSGDWVESMSVLTEDADGNRIVFHFTECFNRSAENVGVSAGSDSMVNMRRRKEADTKVS